MVGYANENLGKVQAIVANNPALAGFFIPGSILGNVSRETLGFGYKSIFIEQETTFCTTANFGRLKPMKCVQIPNRAMNGIIV